MIFARGAVHAALWARGQKPGLYSMADVLGLGKHLHDRDAAPSLVRHPYGARKRSAAIWQLSPLCGRGRRGGRRARARSLRGSLRSQAGRRARLAPRPRRVRSTLTIIPPTATSPVISGGFGRSISSSKVGAMSARRPSATSERLRAPSSNSGTGLVVCEVCGPPVSGSRIISQLPWSAVTSSAPPACSRRRRSRRGRYRPSPPP